MPVVINEFEVVPGDTASGQAGTTTPQEAAVEPRPTPREIALLLEQAVERDERVWAH